MKLPNGIEEINIKWMSQAPFFSEFLYRFNYHYVDDPDNPQPTDIKTIAVGGQNGSINLYISRSGFFDKLPLEQKEGVLVHEIMHLLTYTALRRGTRHHRMFNIASDICINTTIQSTQIGGRQLQLPTNLNDLSTIQKPDKKGRPGYGGKLITEEVYNWMFEKCKKIKFKKSNKKKQEKIKLYRGETANSYHYGKGGIGYYSVDKDYARQFTEHKLQYEVIEKEMPVSAIYDSRLKPEEELLYSTMLGIHLQNMPLPHVGNQQEFDIAMIIAKRLGKKAFRLNEGDGKPDSVYIFNVDEDEKDDQEGDNESIDGIGDLEITIYDPFDEHGEMMEIDDVSAEILNDIINSARVRGYGHISGNMVDTIKDIITPKIDIEKYLHRKLNQVISERTNRVEDSWNRYNRRELPLPGKKYLTNNVIFAVDTSGSITDKHLAKFFGIIEKCCNSFDNVQLIQFDCAFQSIDKYKKNGWRNIKLSGRGGTDPQCVFNYLNEKKKAKNMVIFLTDGEFSYDFDTMGVKDISWIIVNDAVSHTHMTIPHGVNIKLDLYD